MEFWNAGLLLNGLGELTWGDIIELEDECDELDKTRFPFGVTTETSPVFEPSPPKTPALVEGGRIRPKRA